MSGLVVNLERPLPVALPVGRASAVFCFGSCFHPQQPIERLALVVAGSRHRPTAWRMPRRDVFEADPGPCSYRSGFWGTVPVPAQDRAGTVELQVAARLADGRELLAPLGRIEVIEGRRPAAGAGRRPDGNGPIAICMGTFDPNPELFRRQIESLRRQTVTDWTCLISDDCSSPERFAEIERTVAGDARFVVSRSERRIGFYRNFERALGLVPDGAELVALCDQDDRWYPEKLEVLRGAIGDAQLVYSDQRLVDVEGRVLADSMWTGRRNNHTNLASALIANSITGAATLFRREVAELAVPFPDTPGWEFHDHWLGLVALASGEVAYVDRPLYDYVQHEDAILGRVAVRPQGAGGEVEGGPLARLRGWRRFFRGWRATYFCAYLRIEVLAQALLARCSADLVPGKRRALRRVIASDRSPLSLAWLALRPLRRFAGRNETLGNESQLARGILWRHALALRTRRHEQPTETPYDASFPSCGPESFGERQLGRWRARPSS